MALVQKLIEGLVISIYEIAPFQMVREDRRADSGRPGVLFFDYGCEFRQLFGKICDCAVVEELPGSFNSSEAEDFRVRKALRHEWICPRADGFNETYAEELVVGGRDNYIRIVQGLHIFVTAFLISPVVNMIFKLTARLCENFGSFPEALADNVESESNITHLENSDCFEEVFRILVVFPSCGPEDSQWTGLSLPSRRKIVYSQWENGRFEAYIVDCIDGLMIGHGLEEYCKGLEKGVHVKLRVEPDGIGSERACKIGHSEMAIPLIFITNRIGQLIFVKIYYLRQAGNFAWRQCDKFSEIQHVTAKQQVPMLIVIDEFLHMCRESYRRMPHAPLPRVSRQGKHSPVVAARCREPVNEDLVAAAVVWFECQNVHDEIISYLSGKSSVPAYDSIRERLQLDLVVT